MAWHTRGAARIFTSTTSRVIRSILRNAEAVFLRTFYGNQTRLRCGVGVPDKLGACSCRIWRAVSSGDVP